MNRSLKKTVGIILIVLFSLLETCILLTYIGQLYLPIRKDGTSEGFASYLLSILIFAFPLWYGIKLFKESKVNNSPTPVPVSPDEHLKVRVFITPNEYKKITFILSYQTPVVLFGTLVTGTMLVTLIANSIAFPDYRWIFGILFFVLPVSIYFQAGKNYNANNFLKETIEYELNLDNVTAVGETFSATVALKKLNKVKETRSLFLLYTSNLTAYIIPKDRFSNEEEINKLRRMLESAGKQIV